MKSAPDQACLLRRRRLPKSIDFDEAQTDFSKYRKLHFLGLLSPPVIVGPMKTLRNDAGGGFPVTPASRAPDRGGVWSTNATPASARSYSTTPLFGSVTRPIRTPSTTPSSRYEIDFILVLRSEHNCFQVWLAENAYSGRVSAVTALLLRFLLRTHRL